MNVITIVISQLYLFSHQLSYKPIVESTPTVSSKDLQPITTIKPSVDYQLPAFTTELCDNIIAFTLDVKNVVQSSVELEHGSHQAHLKFTSIGSGCFPQYFAFFVRLPAKSGAIVAAQPEVWDNNIILQLELDNSVVQHMEYDAGLNADDLKSFTIGVPQKPKVFADATFSLAKLSLDDSDSNHTESAKKQASKKAKDKIHSYSESNCDDFMNRSESKPPSLKINVPPRTPLKQRAYSECSEKSVDESGQPKHLKGILKRRESSVWSISESSFDENGIIARSAEFTESCGEDNLLEHAKKSVRFDNNIRKFCFR